MNSSLQVADDSMLAKLFRKQENDKESIDRLYKFFMEGNITPGVNERNFKILFYLNP